VDDGAALSPGNLRRRVLKPATEEACLEWVGFHTFRHTCPSMLFAQGRNAVQVQHWLGHHSAAFTLATYVQLLDSTLPEPLHLPASYHLSYHPESHQESAAEQPPCLQAICQSRRADSNR
jgi:site-specific recombinase XerD